MSRPQPAPAIEALPRVLLVGRPNSGKSSLYNAITGGGAHVGNFPGVTVDILEDEVRLPSGRRVQVVDLPGTYSLRTTVDPESDEGHARRFIERLRAEGVPLLVAQVLDSSAAQLNLGLTAELLGLGLPLVVLATQRDVLEAEGKRLDSDVLEKALGVPVLSVSARSKRTSATVLEAVDGWLAHPTVPSPRRFDPEVLARQAMPPRSQSSSVTPLHGAAANAVDGRLRLFRRTTALDRFLMHPLLGPLAFLGIMAGLFWAVFSIADPTSDLVEAALTALTAQLRAHLGTGPLVSFLCEGVIGGAGTVVKFLPQIVLLTIALELLEASGYLARGAFLLDRLLQVAGLGGRSFVPLLMGHACAVPAITATRIIRDPRQRLLTMLVVPLMTCSARIPAFTVLLATFFANAGPMGHAAAFLGLYFTADVLGGLAALVIGRTVLSGRTGLPLVLELPPYRAPQAVAVARVAASAATHFLKEVGTTIVLVSSVLWVLLSVPVVAASSTASEVPAGSPPRTVIMYRSAAAEVGRALEPLTRPLGFDWRINVGLIGAFGAREVMVSTLGVIFGIENADAKESSSLAEQIRRATGPDGKTIYSRATGLALLAFFIVACQCVSTLAALRRETRTWRWPLFVVGSSYAAAYLLALVVFHTAQWAGW